ncbi:LIVCS family branched-chain amino acid:cation transporter [Xenorhabdus ehlersii]|uniref:Branched-chain amino acid transport system carrier protein n=1 Tax=Xenorhabdus ehlersii TaxID=290111 RepID=A0A2D0IYK8_9GAMM|nr:branched-chain amino acid carrier protein [Xenorhabdus ehlersii]RKE92570.1 LIVCS family branched-chain amino acid:cation transporter [Xenorhabdus ehlersii]
MTYRLSSKDIWALGFMTFALFVGTGNIIPPMVDLQAGEYVWSAAAGFLLTAMGLGTCANTVFIRGLA